MSTVATQPAALRRWTAAGAVVLALYVVNTALFCLAVLRPGALAGSLLSAYGRSDAAGPIVAEVLLGLTAFGCYYWPRRADARKFSVLLTGGLAITTIVLGAVAYSQCSSTAGLSPFWSQLTFALNLIVGSVAECEPGQPFPLAIQVGRLFGPLLLVSAAVGIVTSVFRAWSDRQRVRLSRALVVLVGLTDDAMPLLRRLAAERDGPATLCVLVDDAGNALIKAARDLGARVVVCSADNTAALQSLLTSRRTFKVRAFYAVSADVTVNLRWAAQLRTVADSTPASTRGDLAPRLVVRIDDPWQAEYWRRTNAYRTAGSGSSVRWMTDALSVCEVTAALLLDRVLDQALDEPFDRLVLVGSSPLALAVCAELAQREREGEVLGQRPRPSFADLILFGPDAEALRLQHRLRQERFGNDGSTDLISVVVAEPTSEQLRSALRAARRPALVLAEDPAVSAPQLATYLAALNPSWTIFDWSPATHGVADEPLMELLYPFGLTTEAPSSLPLDSWERAARIVHEQYREVVRRHGGLDPDVASHRPWEELDPFLKETNIRQVATALSAAESLGRSWGPVVHGVTVEGLVTSAELSPGELEAMAQREHASWMQQHLEHGWKPGPRRDAARRTHPSLVPWADLGDADREKTRDGVTSALATLNSLGYRSTVLRPEADQHGPWTAVTRRGEVTAVRAAEDWTWVNDSGETMQARAGDWRVTNDEGRTWSVDPDIFLRTYRQLAGDRWRRTGDVRARPAAPGEVVESLEGRQTAKTGDWVIEGAQGERWVTSARHFEANYERLPGPRPEVTPAGEAATG